MDDASAMRDQDDWSERGGRRDAVIFVVLFVVIFGALYGSFTYWDLVRVWVVLPWTRAVASMSAGLMHLFDGRILQTGTVIYGGSFAINVVDGCNGVTPMSLLIAGVLAYPTTWRAKAIGFGVGVPIAVVINLLRIVALYVIGATLPDWFDRSHLYVAQAFVILATAGVWLWWLARFGVPVDSGVSSEPETDS